MENVIGAKLLAPLTFVLVLPIPNVRLVYQVSNRICRISTIFGIEERQKKVKKIKHFSIRGRAHIT